MYEWETQKWMHAHAHTHACTRTHTLHMHLLQKYFTCELHFHSVLSDPVVFRSNDTDVDINNQYCSFDAT